MFNPKKYLAVYILIAIVAFGTSVAVSRFAFAQFSGPSGSAGSGSGAISASNGNVGFGGSASTTSKLYVSATTTYAIAANGNIQAPSFIGTLAASNVSAGLFPASNFAFQSGLGINYNTTVLPNSVKLAVNGSTTISSFLNVATGTLFVDANNSRVGIGTTTPSAFFEVVNPSTAVANSVFRTYGGNTNIGIYSANGTAAAPTQTLANGIIGLLNFRGYGATGFGAGRRAAILAYGSENWTDSAQGTYLTFETTPTGGTTIAERVRIDQNGNVGIATTTPGSPLTVAGVIYSSTGGFKFPDGTTQTTAGTSPGTATTTAANIAAGTFGANVGNGNFNFPANLGIGTASPSTARLQMTFSGTGPVFLTSDGTYGIYQSFQNTFNFNYDQNGDGGGWINYAGYQNGTTRYRTLYIGNGKNTGIASFDGSTGNLSIGNGTTVGLQKLDVNGNIRVNQQIYSPAAYVGFLTDAGAALPIKSGALTVSGSYSNAAETGGIYTDAGINAGGIVRAKGWYTSGTGLALETGISGGQGYVIAYDRTLSSYATLNLQAGSNILTLDVAGNVKLTRAITQTLNQYIYPGSNSGLTDYQTSYYLSSNSGYGLYGNTSLYLVGGVCPGGGYCLNGNVYSTYGSHALTTTKGGYYGILMGSATGNANLMYDVSGNGGVYYESLARWATYYLVGVNHYMIGGANDYGQTLDVTGSLYISSTSTFIGDIKVGASGTGKITAGTIDPVYTIGGKNYATYLPGMTGQKEETAGTVTLKNGKTEIDFKNVSEGSDLWLFSKATNLVNNFSALTVLLTPGFDGKVWYEKLSGNKLVIHGSANGEVSYRFTAPRFDSSDWTNYAKDGETGFNLDSPR